MAAAIADLVGACAPASTGGAGLEPLRGHIGTYTSPPAVVLPCLRAGAAILRWQDPDRGVCLHPGQVLRALHLDLPERLPTLVTSGTPSVIQVSLAGRHMLTIKALKPGAATVEIRWLPVTTQGPITGTFLRVRIR